MAYTELTCDDSGLSLEELYRASLVHFEDGTWAQQVVVVEGGGGDSYEGWDDNGSTDNSLNDNGSGPDTFIDQ